MDFKEIGWDLSGARKQEVADFCKHSNENGGLIKWG
jgi:hypothetical protein